MTTVERLELVPQKYTDNCHSPQGRSYAVSAYISLDILMRNSDDPTGGRTVPTLEPVVGRGDRLQRF